VKTAAINCGMFLILALVITSCSDSNQPELDTTPPEADFELAVWNACSYCPMSVSFYINSGGCMDNETSQEMLQARWDYDNNGEWDTELVPLESFVCRRLPSLPIGTWDVRGEIVDQAGNASISTASIELPDWVSVPPDIVAGEIWINSNDPCTTPADTVKAGEPVFILALKQDWVNDSELSVFTRLFLDDVLIEESVGGPSVCPYWLVCHPPFDIPEGVSDLGRHEFRVEVGIVGEVEETNYENNTSTRVFYVE